MTADLPPPFICEVVRVHDADGPYWCSNGTKVRVASINAREVDGSCRPGAPCPVMRHQTAKPIVERLTLHRRLTCQPVDRSFKRIVARCTLPDGRDLSCEIVRTGAAVWWPVYLRKYGMKSCG